MSVTATGPRLWRRGRSVLAWGAVLVVGTLLIGVLAATQRHPGRLLDPAGTGDLGSRALVNVLRQQGVQVEVARSAAEVERLTIRPSTTVLVAGGDSISPERLDQVMGRVRAAQRVMLVSPTPAQVIRLGLPVDVIDSGDSGPLSATCVTESVDPSDTISGTTTRFVVQGVAFGRIAATGCFPEPVPTGGSAAGPRAVSLVELAATTARPETLLLGAPEILTNGSILGADDARVALRLLGGSAHLIWYLPSPADLAGGPGSAPTGTPAWFGPLLLSLGTAVLVLALWRGRRLGRLVTEPLPVVVPASETMHSRGRLYRAARDRGRAAEVLREGARRRLATRLGLLRRPEPSALVDAVAGATGTPATAVHAILWGEPPSDDAALVTVAEQLDALEEKVRGA